MGIRIIMGLLLLLALLSGRGAAGGDLDKGVPLAGLDSACFPAGNGEDDRADALENRAFENSDESEDPFASEFGDEEQDVPELGDGEQDASGGAAGFDMEAEFIEWPGDGIETDTTHLKQAGGVITPRADSGFEIEKGTTGIPGKGKMEKPEVAEKVSIEIPAGKQSGCETAGEEEEREGEGREEGEKGEKDRTGGNAFTTDTGREPVGENASWEDLSARLTGYAKLGGTWNMAHGPKDKGETDWHGLSRLRAELQLEAHIRRRGWKLFVSGKGMYDFAYGINGRSRYTDGVLDDYEWELALGEAHVQGTLGEDLDIAVGRQVAVWGRSDNFRVTDILNPLDNREPGLVDIEDLRLPLVMTKADYYLGNWKLSLVALHEHRFDKNPPFGHDFFPGSAEVPPDAIPSHTLENTEYAAELKGIFNNWDISFYGARIYNDSPTFIPQGPAATAHQRVTMAGAAMARAAGNFLLIFEVAHFRGLEFMNDYGNAYHRTDLLAGMEYRGFTDTSISLDVMNRHLHGYHRCLETSPEFPLKNDFQVALRITRNLLNERLELTALLVSMGKQAENGAFQRLSATYRIADNWSVTGNLLLYQSGTGLMENAGDNDRVALEIRHDF